MPQRPSDSNPRPPPSHSTDPHGLGDKTPLPPTRSFLHGDPVAKASIFLSVTSEISRKASRVKKPWWPVMMTFGKVIRREK